MLRVRGADLLDAGRAAGSQQGQLTTMDGYVRDHLSRLGAFTGVLGLFRDQYAAALGSVHHGLAAGGDRALALSIGFDTCHRAYTEAEERSRDLLDRLTGSVQGAGEVKLERAVQPLRERPGAWHDVADLGEALGRLDQAGEDLQQSWTDVQDSWEGVRTEAGELGATVEDLGSYADFVDQDSR